MRIIDEIVRALTPAARTDSDDDVGFPPGQWVDAASGRTFETLNPATEEVLAEVARGEAEDVDRAVRAARKAFDYDSALAAHERRRTAAG